MDSVIGLLQSGFSAVVPFIILLGLLIFVHELGHFLVAKYFGVRVEVFSLGFGKKIFKFTRGDTTYAISLIPLGGYVKMFGDEVGAAISEEEKKFSFTHKPVLQRIAVVLAGPLMNFFFAIFIFMIVSLLGEEQRSAVIGDIQESSKAFQIGFRSGDRVLSVENKPLKTWEEFQKTLNGSHGMSLNIKVRRDSSAQEVDLSAVPELRPNPNILSLDEMVGDIEGLGTQSRSTAVGVKGDSVAAKAGFKTGDVIKSIQGNKVAYFREIENLILPLQKTEILFVVERPDEKGQTQKLDLTIPRQSFASLAALGLEPSDLYLYKIMEGTPAFNAGLKAGDRILKVGSTVPTQWEDVLNEVKAYSGTGFISLDVLRGTDLLSFQLTPRMTSQVNIQGAEEKRYTVGIVPWIQYASPETVLMRSENLGAAIERGYKKTIEVTSMTVVSFLRLIQAKISPKNIGGVISIGQAASETFKIGIVHFLQMMAIISVNLFILNLLPIPVLDGGHLLFYTIEAIRGAPVSMRKMEIAQQVGLAVLMSLMVFALFNDFSRLLGGW